jgi:hypothetical protein
MALEEFAVDELNETLITLPTAWYPSHTDLERCLVQAKESFGGPVKLVAVAMYTALYLNKYNLQELIVERLGGFYLSAIEYSMGCSLSALFDSKLRDDYLVMPLLLEILHHMVTTSIETDLPEVYSACHEFYHDLAEHESMTEEMLSVIEPLHEVVKLLDEHGMPAINGSPDQVELRAEILTLLDAAVQPFAQPYGSLPQASQRYLAEPPAVPEAPAAAPSSSPAPSEEAPMVTPHHTPGSVHHLDGSIGLDAHLDLADIFAPRRLTCDNAQAQWDDTLSQFTGTTHELLALWRRVHASPLEGQRHQEARLMDSVGRLLEYLFTAPQLSLLQTRLPMEQVLDNMLSFVSGALNQPPHMSAPQMRISLVSAAIIALTSQETLMHEAEVLWTAIGLSQEVGLLLATLGNHAEALQERIVKVVPPKHTFSYQ